MVKAIVTKTGNSYALRVPMSFVVENKLKLGDTVEVESPVERTKAVLEELALMTKKGGLFKGIKDPVAWQREQRKWIDPWEEVVKERAARR